jgi:hypothetical protein
VRRSLQIFERLDSEVVVELPRPRPSDAGNGEEQGHRVVLAAQPVEHGKPPVSKQLSDRTRDVLAYPGERLESGEAFLVEDLRHGPRESAQVRRRLMVGVHPETVRTLLREDARHFLEPSGDVLVQGDGHLTSPLER